MDKLFETIKEATYDFIGYVLPGSIVMYLILISIKNDINSPVYILFKDISQYNEVLKIMININVIALIIVSYIIGHAISFVSNHIGILVNIISKSLNVSKSSEVTNNNKNYMDIIEEVVLEKYSDDKVVALLDKKEALIYLKRKASTLSRFENHNDLIQKYIYKSKLYSSLSGIFFVLMMDSIISTCVVIIDNKSDFLITQLILYIGVILSISILAISFYKEYNKHCELRKKEEYMYLINRLI